MWVDLVEPDDDERSRVQTELGQNLATRPELEDIEASRVSLKMKTGYTSTRSSFEDADDHAGNSTVAFTIREGRLFTLRERELPAFRLYRMRVRNQTLVDGNAYELLLDLFETKIEQLADEMKTSTATRKTERVIMEGHQGDEYDEALSTLAELEDIGWKVRLCLMDTQRELELPRAQDATITPATLPFTIREGRLFTLREREPASASTVCACVTRRWSTATSNCCSTCSRPKSSSWRMKLKHHSDSEKLSRVIMEGHQGDEYDEALSTLAELEDIGWKVRLCLMDTQRALNFRAQGAAGGPAGAGDRDRICCRTTNRCSRR